MITTSLIMSLAMVCIGVSVLMAIIRTALGPTAFDRVLAVNIIGTLVILGIALHGFIMGRPEFVDISILYAILNFIGTFAILKLFSTGSLGDDAAGQHINPDWCLWPYYLERCLFTYPCRRYG